MKNVVKTNYAIGTRNPLVNFFLGLILFLGIFFLSLPYSVDVFRVLSHQTDACNKIKSLFYVGWWLIPLLYLIGYTVKQKSQSFGIKLVKFINYFSVGYLSAIGILLLVFLLGSIGICGPNESLIQQVLLQMYK